MRLKGGDPFVFGRGGEEAEALRAAGIDFEVVPGVTAGVAAPAYAGIPVTHRDDASAVAFVTGHEDPEKPETALDWDALARFPGTLVLYMGVKNLPQIAAAPDRRRPRSRPSPPRRSSGARARPAACVATLATLADGGRRARASRRPPICSVRRRSPRRREADRLARAPPALRQARRRHPGPRPGQRLGRDASRRSEPKWSSCPRSGSSRDRQDEVRAAVDRSHTYALVCSPARTAPGCSSRRWRRRGWTRAPSPARVAAIGPGTARALRRARHHRRLGPRALRGRGASSRRSPRSRSRASRPGRPRGRGPRRAARGAARAGRRGRRGRRSTGPCASRPTRPVEAARTPTTSPSPRRRPSRTCSRCGGRIAGRSAVVSIGPSPQETAREAGLEVAIEATATTSRACRSPACGSAAGVGSSRLMAAPSPPPVDDSTNTEPAGCAMRGAGSGTLVTGAGRPPGAAAGTALVCAAGSALALLGGPADRSRPPRAAAARRSARRLRGGRVRSRP